MEMILSGRFMAAEEAERAGLVSRIVPDAELLDEAVKVGEKIASMSLPSVILAKAAVDRAFETTLEEGLRYERAVFYSLFATEDQKEGMAAFVEKRQARFRDRWPGKIALRIESGPIALPWHESLLTRGVSSL